MVGRRGGRCSAEALAALGEFGYNHVRGEDPDASATTRLFYMPGIQAVGSNSEGRCLWGSPGRSRNSGRSRSPT